MLNYVALAMRMLECSLWYHMMSYFAFSLTAQLAALRQDWLKSYHKCIIFYLMGFLPNRAPLNKYFLLKQDSKDTDVKSAKAKETGNSVGTSEKTVARETAMAWPMNRQQEKEEQSVGKKTSRKEEGPLFPFEMKVETM